MNKTTQPFYLSSISNAMKGKAAMKKQTTMRGMKKKKKKSAMEFVKIIQTAGGGYKRYVGILCYFADLF